jgi:thymidylate synthase (FAD)
MIRVLDDGYVKLIEAWGSDESIIEAARMSTGKGFNGWGTSQHADTCLHRGIAIVTKCPECENGPGDEKLLGYLYNNKHMTPFEMAGMIIEVKAPIFVFREWHRHRTQSYNEMSARYIPLPDENYIPSIERLMAGANTTTTNKQAQGSKIINRQDAIAFQNLLQVSYQASQLTYDQGLDMGIPKELARLPVPVARYSRMRASTNLRNWLAFLTLRDHDAAQWEIRQYAEVVSNIIKDQFPHTWELYIKGK